MKSIHNTRQDRPIVNATDDTSDALLCAHALAPPVCTAADSPTANSGMGAMNARRSSRGRWRSMAVLIADDAVMLVALIAPALALVGAGNIIGPDGTDDYGKVTADEFKPFIILG